jgi:hypothetical protein
MESPASCGCVGFIILMGISGIILGIGFTVNGSPPGVEPAGALGLGAALLVIGIALAVYLIKRK